MKRIPQRLSLIAQTADILRTGLKKGEWRHEMPGERYLCTRLQVSRSTLHSAMIILQREGLIQISIGRHSQIMHPTAKPKTSNPVKVVGALMALPLEKLRSADLFVVTLLQHHLNAAGFELEFHIDSRWRWEHPEGFLEKLIQRTQVACWILFSVGPMTQKWFVNRKIAALVDGTPHARVRLPSIDYHYEAICRHATGEFLRLGHRQVVYLTPRSANLLGGQFASKQGFLEGFETTQYSDANPRILHHDGSVNGIRTILDTLLSSRHPPTGILVSSAKSALTVLGHLINQGLRLPRDLSMMADIYEPFLSDAVPSVTSYEIDLSLYAKRLSRLTIELATTKLLPPRATYVMARFRKGETLGPVNIN